MNTNTAMDAWDEQDLIEPEGGLDMSDLTTEEEGIDLSSEDNSPDIAEDVAPTTESSSETADPSGTNVSDAPTTEQVNLSMPTTLKFKAKVDHEEMDVSLDSSFLPALFQKAQNYDRMQERHNKSTDRLNSLDSVAKSLGFESIDDMVQKAHDSNRAHQIEALVEGGTAKEIAEFYIDHKMAPSRSSSDEDSGAENNKFDGQVAELYAARPDLRGNLTELPDEVTMAVINGDKSLLAAYTEWERKQMKAENERLKNERNAFERQADAASRSPVRGTTTTGSPQQGKKDPWLIGFGDDY